jgi:hypothetical protein
MSFRRYEVNVVIGDQRSGSTGAPIVYEGYPTHPNLLGRIEHVARFEMLVTDFALIKPGARARAGTASTRQVLAILDPTPAGSRAVSVAQQLSVARGATLAVAMVSAEQTGLAALRETARRSIPAVRADARLLRLADTSVKALADAARVTACDVLVLGSDVFPRERGEFRSLLERVRCPVVLVG